MKNQGQRERLVRRAEERLEDEYVWRQEIINDELHKLVRRLRRAEIMEPTYLWERRYQRALLWPRKFEPADALSDEEPEDDEEEISKDEERNEERRTDGAQP